MIAKQSLGIAQTHIAKRLRALYINGDSGGAVDVILGAQSLDDLVNRLGMPRSASTSRTRGGAARRESVPSARSSFASDG